MARRRSDRDDNGVFEDMFELFLLTPIWVGPIAAALTFSLFRYIAPMIFPAKPQGEFDPGVVLREFFPMLAWMLTGFVLLIWMVAELIKLIRRGRERFERTTAPMLQATSSSLPDSRRRTDRPADSSAAPTPLCPACGSKTILRHAKRGPSAGSSFFGCIRYPDCKGIVPAA